MTNRRRCKEPGCDGEHYALGLCRRHWRQRYDRDRWASMSARRKRARLEQMRKTAAKRRANNSKRS